MVFLDVRRLLFLRVWMAPTVIPVTQDKMVSLERPATRAHLRPSLRLGSIWVVSMEAREGAAANREPTDWRAEEGAREGEVEKEALVYFVRAAALGAPAGMVVTAGMEG